MAFNEDFARNYFEGMSERQSYARKYGDAGSVGYVPSPYATGQRAYQQSQQKLSQPTTDQHSFLDNINPLNEYSYERQALQAPAEQFVGIFSSLMNIANLADPTGTLGKWADKVDEWNQDTFGAKKEFSMADRLGQTDSDYYTNPQGFTRDVSGMVGSMLGLRGAGMVIKGLGAVAKSAGGAKAAQAANAALKSKGVNVGALPEFAQKTFFEAMGVPATKLAEMTGKSSLEIAKEIPNMPQWAKTLIGSKFVRTATGNLSKEEIGALKPLQRDLYQNAGNMTLAETLAEAGEAAGDIRREGGDWNAQMATALKNAIVEWPTLSASNRLQVAAAIKMFGGEGVWNMIAYGLANGASQYGEEAFQRSSQDWAKGDPNVGFMDMYNPFAWSEGAHREGWAGAVGSIPIAMVTGFSGGSSKKSKTNQQAPNAEPTAIQDRPVLPQENIAEAEPQVPARTPDEAAAVVQGWLNDVQNRVAGDDYNRMQAAMDAYKAGDPTGVITLAHDIDVAAARAQTPQNAQDATVDASIDALPEEEESIVAPEQAPIAEETPVQEQPVAQEQKPLAAQNWLLNPNVKNGIPQNHHGAIMQFGANLTNHYRELVKSGKVTQEDAQRDIQTASDVVGALLEETAINAPVTAEEAKMVLGHIKKMENTIGHPLPKIIKDHFENAVKAEEMEASRKAGDDILGEFSRGELDYNGASTKYRNLVYGKHGKDDAKKLNGEFIPKLNQANVEYKALNKFKNGKQPLNDKIAKLPDNIRPQVEAVANRVQGVYNAHSIHPNVDSFKQAVTEARNGVADTMKPYYDVVADAYTQKIQQDVNAQQARIAEEKAAEERRQAEEAKKAEEAKRAAEEEARKREEEARRAEEEAKVKEAKEQEETPSQEANSAPTDTQEELAKVQEETRKIQEERRKVQEETRKIQEEIRRIQEEDTAATPATEQVQKQEAKVEQSVSQEAQDEKETPVEEPKEAPKAEKKSNSLDSYFEESLGGMTFDFGVTAVNEEDAKLEQEAQSVERAEAIDKEVKTNQKNSDAVTELTVNPANQKLLTALNKIKGFDWVQTMRDAMGKNPVIIERPTNKADGEQYFLSYDGSNGFIPLGRAASFGKAMAMVDPKTRNITHQKWLQEHAKSVLAKHIADIKDNNERNRITDYFKDNPEEYADLEDACEQVVKKGATAKIIKGKDSYTVVITGADGQPAARAYGSKEYALTLSDITNTVVEAAPDETKGIPSTAFGDYAKEQDLDEEELDLFDYTIIVDNKEVDVKEALNQYTFYELRKSTEDLKRAGKIMDAIIDEVGMDSDEYDYWTGYVKWLTEQYEDVIEKAPEKKANFDFVKILKEHVRGWVEFKGKSEAEVDTKVKEIHDWIIKEYGDDAKNNLDVFNDGFDMWKKTFKVKGRKDSNDTAAKGRMREVLEKTVQEANNGVGTDNVGNKKLLSVNVGVVSEAVDYAQKHEELNEKEASKAFLRIKIIQRELDCTFEEAEQALEDFKAGIVRQPMADASKATTEQYAFVSSNQEYQDAQVAVRQLITPEMSASQREAVKVRVKQALETIKNFRGSEEYLALTKAKERADEALKNAKELKAEAESFDIKKVVKSAYSVVQYYKELHKNDAKQEVVSAPIKEQAFVDANADMSDDEIFAAGLDGLEFQTVDKNEAEQQDLSEDEAVKVRQSMFGNLVAIGARKWNDVSSAALSQEAKYKQWFNSVIDTLKNAIDNASNKLKRSAKSIRKVIEELLVPVHKFLSKLKKGTAVDFNNVRKAFGLVVQAKRAGATAEQAEQAAKKQLAEAAPYVEAAYEAYDYFPTKGGQQNDISNTSAGDSGRAEGDRAQEQLGADSGATDAGTQRTDVVPAGGTSRDVSTQTKTGKPVSTGGTVTGGTRSDNGTVQAQAATKSDTSRSEQLGGSTRTGRNGSERSERMGETRPKGESGSKGADGAQGKKDSRSTESETAEVKAQKAVMDKVAKGEKVEVKRGDKENIKKTLPILIGDAINDQVSDIVAIEKHLFERAKQAFLVGNGTGTGKTIVGLATIARHMMEGKKRILVVAPGESVAGEWIDTASKLFGLKVNRIAHLADSPVEGINLVSYSALCDNQNLAKQNWDLVVFDEAHHLAMGYETFDGHGRTKAVEAMRALTGHEKGFDGYRYFKHKPLYDTMDLLVKRANQKRDEAKKLQNRGINAGNVIEQVKKYVADYNAIQRQLDNSLEADRKAYAQYQAEAKKTKTLFLSATPFEYSNDVYWAEGYLFNYNDFGGYENMMTKTLGLEKRTKKEKVDNISGGQDVMSYEEYITPQETDPVSNKKRNVDRTAQQRAFHYWLKDTGGYITRRLQTDKDYSRKFVIVGSETTNDVVQGLRDLKAMPGYDELYSVFFNRLSGNKMRKFFEIEKTKALISDIEKSLAKGDHILFVHKFKASDTINHPFRLTATELNGLTQKAKAQYTAFGDTELGRKLQAMPLDNKLAAPDILKAHFGDKCLIVNSSVSNKRAVIDKFNEPGPHLLVATIDSIGEGVSAHDKVGGQRRKLINIAIPEKPSDIAQTEARIFRWGQKSNAQIYYVTSNTDAELVAYSYQAGSKAQAQENLALGDDARFLMPAFELSYYRALLANAKGEDVKIGADDIDSGSKAEDSGEGINLHKAVTQVRKELQAIMDEADVLRGIQRLETQLLEAEQVQKAEAEQGKPVISPEAEQRFVKALGVLSFAKSTAKVGEGQYEYKLRNGMTLKLDLTKSSLQLMTAKFGEERAKQIDDSGKGVGGAAVENTIYFTELVNGDTPGHELMHFVFNAILTPSQKQTLMKWARYNLEHGIANPFTKKKGKTVDFSKLTAEQQETACREYIADGLPDFIKAEEDMSKDMSLSGTMKQIFHQIHKWWAQLKALVGKESALNVYSSVKEGTVFNENDNTSQNTEFQVVDKIEESEATRSELEQQRAIIDGMKGEPLKFEEEVKEPKKSRKTKDEYEQEQKERQEIIDKAKNILKPEIDKLEARRREDPDSVAKTVEKEVVDALLNSGAINVDEDSDKTQLEKDSQISLLNALRSNHWIAKANPLFKSFFDMGIKAAETQETIRTKWLGVFDKALQNVKGREEQYQLNEILLAGDEDGKEYTPEELKKMGASDGAIKAYRSIRRLTAAIWRSLDNARRHVTPKFERSLTVKELKEKLAKLQEDKFCEDFQIKKAGDDNFVALSKFNLEKLDANAKYDLTYKRPVVNYEWRVVNKEQLDEIRNSPYEQIVDRDKVNDISGNDDSEFTKVKVAYTVPHVKREAGYMPHLFEEWLIVVDGVNKEGKKVKFTVGSAKTKNDAVRKAAEILKNTPALNIWAKKEMNGYSLKVRPKIFDASVAFGGQSSEELQSGNGDALVTSAQRRKMIMDLVKKNEMAITMDEAAKYVDEHTKRTSAHRMFGNLLERTGAIGYNTDMLDSFERYIKMASRYVALEDFKYKAIPLYENTFKVSFDSNEDVSRYPIATLIKRYIENINGKPSALEKAFNNILKNIPFLKNYMDAEYGDRWALTAGSKINQFWAIAKLSNPSSAIVNMLQLSNTYAFTGSDAFVEGLKGAKIFNEGRPKESDANFKAYMRVRKIVKDTGVLDMIALNDVGGYAKNRQRIITGSGKSSSYAKRQVQKAWDAYTEFGNKYGLYLFRKADQASRVITAIAAYEKHMADAKAAQGDAFNEAKEHHNAILKAQDVLRKAMFDYGVADTPIAMQAFSGTGIGETMLLFKKYPIKQMELMMNMSGFFGDETTQREKVRFWVTYAALCGLSGIPLGDLIDNILEGITGHKLTTYLKANVLKGLGTDGVSGAFAKALCYGAFGATGLDVSRRVGIADAFSGDSGFLSALGGVTASSMSQFFQGATNGDVPKMIKSISPWAGSMAEAVVGERKDSRGRTAFKYEGLDRALKFIGFRPASESVVGDLQSHIWQSSNAEKEARKSALDKYAGKIAEGKKLTQSELQDLHKHNIKSATLMKAVREKKMTTAERTKSYLPKGQQREYSELLNN